VIGIVSGYSSLGNEGIVTRAAVVVESKALNRPGLRNRFAEKKQKGYEVQPAWSRAERTGWPEIECLIKTRKFNWSPLKIQVFPLQP
jgi:hypothetical protein